MHSHDRTLLSRLGFQDPDRQNSKHDLACQYLAESEQAIKIATMYNPEKSVLHNGEYDICIGNTCRPLRFVIIGEDTQKVESVGCYLEQPITKGEGKYLTFIGFLDLCLTPVIKHTLVGKKRPSVYGGESPDISDHTDDWSSSGSMIAVEVKVTPTPIGDVLKQINLYRTYVNAYWVLATTYPLQASDKAVAERAGIRCIRLAEGFDRWVAARKDNSGTCAEEEI